MEWNYGENFRCAFIDHPTLTISQLMSQISSSILSSEPHADKFHNLSKIKERLIELKKAGGKAIIIVDEGHTLCGKPEVLQDLRMLLNLTHEKEYLFTMILSGQKPLWDEMKRVPEFWQRLPVKYYLLPLRLEETRNLVNHRLSKAGADEDREIFSTESFEIIQRFAHGLPRTIVALCDLCLLVGSAYQARRIGYKEVSKAINAMSGKGEVEEVAFGGVAAMREEPSFLRSLMNRLRGRS
jgi:type II secretory pathway predicted ATPase ExeA